METVGVVGAGISGLVAAWHLVQARPDLRVMVFEAGDRVGGKLRQEEIAGHLVDVGAESALWRRPEVAELLDELGVEAVHPVRLPALLWSRGRLETLPAGTLMGVPSDPRSAAGLLDDAEVARAADERPVTLGADADISVGDAVEQALGSAVVDRMVEPLLGGVYAGHARELSVRACVPVLHRALSRGASLTDAARSAASAVSSTDDRPVFGAPAGGMGALPELLRARLHAAGVEVLTAASVTSIERAPAFKNAWHLEVERDGLTEPIDVDGVVLAVPAPVAATLLPTVAAAAIAPLSEVEYASMAIVTYAFPREVLDLLPAGTGFLVPAVDGHDIKASTFSTVKWPWLAQATPDTAYVRVSLGRHREDAVLDRPDADLVELGLTDLAAALGPRLPAPIDTHVQRWRDGLPQYPVGHVESMTQVTSVVADLPAFGLAGAHLAGVGIPACVAGARRAAQTVLDDLAVTNPPLATTPNEGAGQ